MKYVYPAVFTEEENEYYSVRFDDIEGCFTSGLGLEESMEMAEDALCLMLYRMEIDGKTIPPASDIKKIITKEKEFVTLIKCDTAKYEKL